MVEFSKVEEVEEDCDKVWGVTVSLWRAWMLKTRLDLEVGDGSVVGVGE